MIEDELDAIEQLRRDILNIAEHYSDADYQRKNYPTMHARSNINGLLGEFEKYLAQNYRPITAIKEAMGEREPNFYGSVGYTNKKEHRNELRTQIRSALQLDEGDVK